MLKKSSAAMLLTVAMLLSGCQPKVDQTQSKDPINAVVQKGPVDKTTTAKPTSTGTKTTKVNPTEPKPAGTMPVKTGAVGSAATDPPAADAVFTLVASGDVVSHITNTKSAKLPDGSYDYLPQFTEVAGLLSDADYTLVNLEAPVAGEQYGYNGFPTFNAPINLAQTMKKIGVDLVVTANNHAMDNGLQGITDNLDNLDKIGLDHTGTYRSEEESTKPFIKDINGIKVGFVAFTFAPDFIPVPNDYSINLNSTKQIRAKIKDAREAGAEMIVFHVHWGKEYTEYPSQPQMDRYKVLEEEGVDIVIGSHPHRLQPIEIRQIEYQGKKKNQAVIWSTGNLYQGQTKLRDYINVGSIFKLKVERKNGIISVNSLDYELIYNLRWIDAQGDEMYKIIPEAKMDQYQTEFPNNYKIMEKEFIWAHETLNTPVDVIYSDGTSSLSNKIR